MAISKIITIRESKGNFPGRHLKVAIDYISNGEKTSKGKYVGYLNCVGKDVYNQMIETKENFGKTDKRQAFHIIISFKEGEVDGQTAFDIVGRFAKSYLGDLYEAIYTVHDNTDHLHGHITFNSVSFLTGKKYAYKKGDWAKDIQPIINSLCKEYNLSSLDLDEISRRKISKEWNETNEGSFVWNEMIKRDLDACILQAINYGGFKELLVEKGYEIKEGKYLSIKPQGMNRFRRTKTLGDAYSKEAIEERIILENLSSYQARDIRREPKIVYSRIKRNKRAKLSKLQKRHFAKLYRLKKLKKKPYSKVWMYRDDIKKMKEIQEEYLFLKRWDIGDFKDLINKGEILTNKKKDLGSKKSQVFKERGRFLSIFKTAQEVEDLQRAEKVYQNGNKFFEEEHKRWVFLQDKLKVEGYSLEEVLAIKEHFKNEISRIREEETILNKEIKLVNRLIKDGKAQREEKIKLKIENELSKTKEKSKSKEKSKEINRDKEREEKQPRL